MFNLRSKFDDFIFRLTFSDVPTIFNSKNKLFRLTFDENWIYSGKGNSFYSFHNEKEGLKGGLQLSFQWNVQSTEGKSEQEEIEELIRNEEEEVVQTKPICISSFRGLYYFINAPGSNMDFHNWVIYQDQVLVIIKFMIFEEESSSTKAHWLERVTAIINSLELDESKFQRTRMR